MGRKGAGRAGFMKANRSQLVEEEAEPVAAPQAAPAAAPAPAAPATAAPAEAQAPAPPVISTKAAAFLKDAPAGSDDDEEASGSQAGPKGGPTRGQVVQRHKREVKALKETAKKLGKKGKEEVARQEAEMQQSHAAELAALDSATGPSTAETIALADSLYSATLSGDPPSEGAGKKLTKAQKRREQRAKEDAERDARIAAENANLGETERMVEERELLNLLSPLGLAVRDIPADGHCLYRSVEDQLRGLPDGGAAAAAAASIAPAPPGFLALRQAAAQYMRAHEDHFRHFVLESDTADGAVLEGEDAFAAYCGEVADTAAWGGEVELQALAQALHAHLQVFSVGLPVLEVGEEFKGQGPTLRLCYLRHAYTAGEHYNSVVEASGEEEGGEEEKEEGGESGGLADGSGEDGS